MEVTFTESLMEAPVAASMVDYEELEASTEVFPTGPFTKASTKASMEPNSRKSSLKAAMAVTEASVKVMKAFIQVTSTGAFMENSVEVS